MKRPTTTDIFTHFFATQIRFHIAKREGIIDRMTKGGPDETPPAWRELEKEDDKFMDDLKKRGEYFHDGGGSVFMDFKNLRDSIVLEGGMDKIAEEFSSQMSKDELLKKARSVVEEWQASSGRERKR